MDDLSDLEALDEKLKQAENLHQPSPKELEAQKDAENKRVGLQAGLELTGSIVVGVFIGVALDQWLETKPLFILIFFFIGVCTGFFNVYRVTNNLGSSVGFSRLHKERKDAKTSPDIVQPSDNDQN